MSFSVATDPFNPRSASSQCDDRGAVAVLCLSGVVPLTDLRTHDLQASDVKLEEQAGGVSGTPGAPKSEGTTAEGVLGPAPGGKGTTEAGLKLLSAATSFQAEVDSFASRALRRLLWHNDTDVPQPPRHLLRAREAPPEHQQVPC